MRRTWHIATLRLLGGIAVGAATMFAAGGAQAAPVTISFEGLYLLENSPTLAGLYASGDEINVSFTYDTVASSSGVGVFIDSSIAISGIVDGQSFESNFDQITLNDDPFSHSIRAGSNPNFGTFSGFTRGGFELARFSVSLSDSSATVLTDLSSLPDEIDFSDFSFIQITTSFIDPNAVSGEPCFSATQCIVRWSLTQQTSMGGTVPAPAALGLLSLGLAGLFFQRRRWALSPISPGGVVRDAGG